MKHVFHTERKNLQTHRITLVHLKKKTRKNIYKNSISETKTERKIEWKESFSFGIVQTNNQKCLEMNRITKKNLLVMLDFIGQTEKNIGKVRIWAFDCLENTYSNYMERRKQKTR